MKTTKEIALQQLKLKTEDLLQQIKFNQQYEEYCIKNDIQEEYDWYDNEIIIITEE